MTVDNKLPFVTTNWENKNGSTLEFANGAKGQPIWAELVEKAFAQLNAETTPFTVTQPTRASNAYSGIGDGEPQNALEEITGQSSITYYANKLVANEQDQPTKG